MLEVDWAFRQKDRFETRRRFMRDFLLNTLAFNLLLDVSVQGAENIPESGGVILMINHVTAIDPMIVAGAVRHRFVVIMSKAENFRNPLVRLLIGNWGGYPVRRGEVDRRALKITLDLLSLGEMVLMAPEGSRHSQLSEAKGGTAYIGLKSRAVIVPTAIYNADTWRRDLILPRRTPVQVIFGRPFRLRQDERKRVPREEMDIITTEMMCQLASLLPPRYRGAYADLDKLSTDRLEFIDQAHEIGV